MAFEFPDECEQEILAYLVEREGKGFGLQEIPAQLDAGGEIIVIVPVYDGNNLIHADRLEDVADMVCQAVGTDGQCVHYVKGIADELDRLGIDDPTVSELWRTLVQSDRNSRASCAKPTL